MRNDSLQEFKRLHSELLAEKNSIENRLRQISEVLGGLQQAAESGGSARGNSSAAPSGASQAAPAKRGRGRPKGGGMSAEGRARIAEAQRARWAKTKGTSSGATAKAAAPKASSGGKRQMSPAARAAIAEAARRRWAAAKKAGKTRL